MRCWRCHQEAMNARPRTLSPALDSMATLLRWQRLRTADNQPWGLDGAAC